MSYCDLTDNRVVLRASFIIPKYERKVMGKPKKRTSSRKTGMRRSHLVIKLARAVNAKSPVKAKTTKKETGKAKAA